MEMTMYMQQLLDGEWLFLTGGSTIKSRRLRFVRNEIDYTFEISYKFDVDDEVILRFQLSNDEIQVLTNDLQKNQYAKIETEKNSRKFVLELQLFPDGLEIRLDGHGISWPGHPQRFLMTEFERVEFNLNDEE